jgi:hypothetical protein
VAWLYDHVRSREEGRPPPPPALRTNRAARLLRVVTAARAVGAVAALLVVVGVGWPAIVPRWALVAAACLLTAAVAGGTLAVARLAALERAGHDAPG